MESDCLKFAALSWTLLLCLLFCVLQLCLDCYDIMVHALSTIVSQSDFQSLPVNNVEINVILYCGYMSTYGIINIVTTSAPVVLLIQMSSEKGNNNFKIFQLALFLKYFQTPKYTKNTFLTPILLKGR